MRTNGSKILSKEECTAIIRNKLKDDECSVLSFEIKPISENVEGFLGEHNSLDITYEKKDGTTGKQRLFLKRIEDSVKSVQLRLTDQLNAYEKEIFCYDFLWKEYEKRGYDISFAAKSYYCKKNNMILDDLTTLGFQTVGKQTIFDFDHCRLVLRALAKLHACGIRYQEAKTAKLGKKFKFSEVYPNIFKEKFFLPDEEMVIVQWLKNSAYALIELVDYLPHMEYSKDELQRMLRKFAQDYHLLIEPPARFLTTFTHGDLWSNNMLFKYERNVPVDCRLIDFQIVRQNVPAFDIMLVMYTNTTEEFRRKHLIDILRIYYQFLSDELAKDGLICSNIFPFEQLKTSCDFVAPLTMFQAAATHLLIYMPEDITRDLLKDDQSFDVLIGDRTNVSIRCYNHSKEFKNIIDKDMEQFGEILKKAGF